MKLSLCAIAKNEEIALPKCLSSVKDVVNEIVVLDTGSTDRTVEIAREFGAKVYHFDWCNDFSAARNQALNYVTGDWILVLDADETLTPEIVPHLQQAIDSDRYLVINLLRQEVGAVQSPYSLVSRLFRRHSNIRFDRPYHALIDDSVAQILTVEPQWQIGYLPAVAILHSGYQKGAIAQKDKWQQAAKTMEGFLFDHPTDPYVCCKLGALYVESGKIEQGIELLQRGVSTTSVDVQILEELHYHLGIAYTKLNHLSQAIANYQAAIDLDVYPMLKLGAYNNLGNLWLATGNFLAAKTVYETTLQIDPNFAFGYYNYGITLKAIGRFTEAIAAYKQAIELNPNYAPAYQNLGVVLLKLGKITEGIAAFRQAIALYEIDNLALANRLRQSLQEIGHTV